MFKIYDDPGFVSKEKLLKEKEKTIIDGCCANFRTLQLSPPRNCTGLDTT